MARTILKSNNALVIAGQRPAFDTVDRVGATMSGAYMSLVQNTSIGFSSGRQKARTLGSDDFLINDINRMPDVDLQIDYIHTPTMLNETLLGLKDAVPSDSGIGLFAGYTNEDQNFYVLMHPDQGEDHIQGDDSYANVTGDVICLGNSFLTNYSVNFAVGSIPFVSTSYKCSNIKVISGAVDEITNPAINLEEGDQIGAGIVTLADSSIEGLHNTTPINRFDPPLCAPSDVHVTLENLEIGGIPIDDTPSVQNLSMDIPVDRVDLHGLGSNYPYGRPVHYPITSSLSMSLLASEFINGQLTSLMSAEATYDFDVLVNDQDEVFQNTYHFENLRLESQRSSMQVNGFMKYDLVFSFEITN